MQNKLLKTEAYAPAEDTIFLANYLQHESGDCALDIGTGTGYLAKVLSTGFDFVVGTDISFNSLKEADLDNCICCSGASTLATKFDLVVCNLPYLPSKEVFDITVDGGMGGVRVALKIIESAKDIIKKGGKFLFLTSSLANYRKLMKKMESLGFCVRIVATKKVFFEQLILVEATR